MVIFIPELDDFFPPYRSENFVTLTALSTSSFSIVGVNCAILDSNEEQNILPFALTLVFPHHNLVTVAVDPGLLGATFAEVPPPFVAAVEV